jgi:uncharacterized repeat protein (TIGR03943 family)
VNRMTQSVVVALLGVTLVAITVSGRFTSYVRPGFEPLLMIGGCVLVAVGVLSQLTSLRTEKSASRVPSAIDSEIPRESSHGPGEHDHHHSKAPWLILIPVLVLVVVTPPALGAGSVAQMATSQATVGGGSAPPDGSVDGGVAGGGEPAEEGGPNPRLMEFPPLPPGDSPHLELQEVNLRALYDKDNSLIHDPVSVTAFIAPSGEGFSSGFTLARLVISCCAADAFAIQLHIVGDAPLPENTWVEAIITATPDPAILANGYVPTFAMKSFQQIPQPADPYLH